MPVGPLMANAFLVGDETSREAVIVDPGQELDPFLRRVREEGWRVTAIVATHGHFDHIGGAMAATAATGAPLYMPEGERHWAFDPHLNRSAVLSAPGLPEVCLDSASDIRVARGGDRWTIGTAELHALATPGHTPGGLSYYAPLLGESGAVFTGDTLFAGTIGRSDRPEHGERLIASIRSALLVLPPSTVVLPGHGRSTTVEEERLFNPYLG